MFKANRSVTIIKSNTNTSVSICLTVAERLFRPLTTKPSSSDISIFALAKRRFGEFIDSISRYFYKKRFIENLDKLISTKEEFKIVVSDPKAMLIGYEKKLRQLNSLLKIYLLITNETRYSLPIRMELTLKEQTLKIQNDLNKAINSIEEKKHRDKVNSNPAIEASPESDPPLSSVIVSSPPKETPTHSNPTLPTVLSRNISIWERAKKWGGLSDIGLGVQCIQKGDYRNGLYGVTKGSLRIIFIATLTALVVYNLSNKQSTSASIIPQLPEHNPMCSFDRTTYISSLKNISSEILGGQYIIPSAAIHAMSQSVQIDSELINPIPDSLHADHAGSSLPAVDRSQIQSEVIYPSPATPSVTLITAYDDGIKDYAQHVIPNQRAFAEKHRYNYIEYQGNLAHDEGVPRAPYWSKIVALNDQLKKTRDGDWIVWLDASAVFTNTEMNFDKIICSHGTGKDIILTTDPQVPINNAVFLIRNSPWTRKWIRKVWERKDLAKGGEGKCWSWGQPFCHYEQQAMTELWQRSQAVQSHTALIPNKVMNSFYRFSHYDPYRKLQQNYDQDPESAKWAPGDFICKVTGMDRDRRLEIIKYIASKCIDLKGRLALWNCWLNRPSS